MLTPCQDFRCLLNNQDAVKLFLEGTIVKSIIKLDYLDKMRMEDQKKTKYIGTLFLCKDWPPSPAQLSQWKQQTKQRLHFSPTRVLYHPDMPEIDLGRCQLEAVLTKQIPKNCVWLVVDMAQYANSVGICLDKKEI